MDCCAEQSRFRKGQVTRRDSVARRVTFDNWRLQQNRDRRWRVCGYRRFFFKDCCAVNAGAGNNWFKAHYTGLAITLWIPMWYSGFCIKLRVRHRGTSLGPFACGARACSLCSSIYHYSRLAFCFFCALPPLVKISLWPHLLVAVAFPIFH